MAKSVKPTSLKAIYKALLPLLTLLFYTQSRSGISLEDRSHLQVYLRIHQLQNKKQKTYGIWGYTVWFHCLICILIAILPVLVVLLPVFVLLDLC